MKALLVLIALAGTAHAFPAGSQFDVDPVTNDGAGGVAFTGAPRWAAHTCDSCHTDPPHLIGAELLADPTDLFNGYEPLATYQLRVVLTNEWAGVDAAAFGDDCGPLSDPYQPCDDNGFALEIDDASGVPAGSLAPLGDDGLCDGTPATTPDVYVLNDGTAVMHSGFRHAQSDWNLCWTAPDVGTGPLTTYVAVVDGNGGDGTVDNPNDSFGDDVFAGAVAFRELGGDARGANQGGCAVALGGAAPVALVLLIIPLLIYRRRAGLLLVLLLALGVGCATTKPWQRETLAKRKMQLGADPAEDQLDLHMQEAREGASGGMGSAGGGCGCN